MFKLLSKRILIIIFLVLLLGVVLIRWFDDQKNENTFRSELVHIDTAAVTVLRLSPKGLPELRIYKEEGRWKLESGEKQGLLEPAVMPSMLAQLQDIKPLHLVAKDESRWSEFEVNDSLGTRVRVSEGTKVTLDIVIGKFDFKPQTRSAFSYVRLYEDVAVYAVKGFLSFTFIQEFEKLLLKPEVEEAGDSVVVDTGGVSLD